MKVLIADDHPMVRDALARTVLALQPDAKVLQAQDFAQVLAALRDGPDLLLLDIHMPGMDGVDGVAGVEGVRRLCEAFPARRIVVASGDDDPQVIRSVLALGVAGFLPKTATAAVLMQAIQRALGGVGWLPGSPAAGPGDDRQPPHTGAAGLTPRQLQVLQLLAQGQPNKLIARALGLTEGTVKIHIAAILRALKARNRTEAVVLARRLGIAG